MTSAREALVDLLADVYRSHEMIGNNNIDPTNVVCNGSEDPVTNEWCNFFGTPEDWLTHLKERINAALEHHEQKVACG